MTVSFRSYNKNVGMCRINFNDGSIVKDQSFGIPKCYQILYLQIFTNGGIFIIFEKAETYNTELSTRNEWITRIKTTCDEIP